MPPDYRHWGIKKKITHNYPISSWDGIFSKGLKNQFQTAMVNEPSVFEQLKFYCMPLILNNQALIVFFIVIFVKSCLQNDHSVAEGIEDTLMCLSIGTPKNNKFSICSKWKIYYF